MKTIHKKCIIASIILVMIGLFIPHFRVFLIFFFFAPLPLIIYCLVGIIYGIVEWVNKKNLGEIWKNMLPFAIPVILFVLSVFTSVYVVRKYKEAQMNQLIMAIENFKKETNFYPNSNSVIVNKKELFQYKYRYDSTQNNYRISYKKDGLIWTVYDNATKKWTDYGWND